MLPDAENFMQQEQNHFLFVLRVQFAVHLVLLRGPSEEVGNSRRRHSQLDLRELVDIDACDHRILVLL